MVRPNLSTIPFAGIQIFDVRRSISGKMGEIWLLEYLYLISSDGNEVRELHRFFYSEQSQRTQFSIKGFTYDGNYLVFSADILDPSKQKILSSGLYHYVINLNTVTMVMDFELSDDSYPLADYSTGILWPENNDPTAYQR